MNATISGQRTFRLPAAPQGLQATSSAPVVSMPSDTYTTKRSPVLAGGSADESVLSRFFAVLWSNIKYVFGYRDTPRDWSEVWGAPNGPTAPGATPAPAPVPANLPPITTEDVRNAAREYLSAHPEIVNEPSYENTAAVAQLREGVIAILTRKGYRAGRILGPDGQPYPQMLAFGNPGDPDARAYRITAGGGRIERAIEAGYYDDNVPWSAVH